MFVVGLLLDDGAQGNSLIVLGVGVLTFGVILPVAAEAEIGPGGIKFKTAMADRDAQFEAYRDKAAEGFGRFAVLILGSEEQARDLVDDALVRTYEVWTAVPSEERHAYVRCTLVRLLLGASRLGLVRGPVPSTPDDEAAGALRSLPPTLRAVAVLRDYEGLAIEEIAKILDRPVDSVRDDADDAEARLASLLEAPASPA